MKQLRNIWVQEEVKVCFASRHLIPCCLGRRAQRRRSRGSQEEGRRIEVWKRARGINKCVDSEDFAMYGCSGSTMQRTPDPANQRGVESAADGGACAGIPVCDG